MTRTRTIAAAAAAFGIILVAPAAVAQLDPGMIAQGQVIAGTARGYAERGGWRDRGTSRYSGVSAQQRQACLQKARFRSEYGAGHPKVARLYSLCRNAGL